jgi:hypothetical protein
MPHFRPVEIYDSTSVSDLLGKSWGQQESHWNTQEVIGKMGEGGNWKNINN